MRTCPFTGCGRSIPDTRFACGPHWHRLGRAQQTTIYQAYDRYLRDAINVDELRRIQQEVIGQVEGAARG